MPAPQTLLQPELKGDQIWCRAPMSLHSLQIGMQIEALREERPGISDEGARQRLAQNECLLNLCARLKMSGGGWKDCPGPAFEPGKTNRNGKWGPSPTDVARGISAPCEADLRRIVKAAIAGMASAEELVIFRDARKTPDGRGSTVSIVEVLGGGSDLG